MNLPTLTCRSCGKSKPLMCFQDFQQKSPYPRCTECIREYGKKRNQELGYVAAKGMMRL